MTRYGNYKAQYTAIRREILMSKIRRWQCLLVLSSNVRILGRFLQSISEFKNAAACTDKIICLYCARDKSLIKAHVIPEAFFRRLRVGEKSPLLIRQNDHVKRSPISVRPPLLLVVLVTCCAVADAPTMTSLIGA